MILVRPSLNPLNHLILLLFWGRGTTRFEIYAHYTRHLFELIYLARCVGVYVRAYSCFEKGCLTNKEKRTRQCRKWLWVIRILGFHDWSSRFLKPAEGNSTKPYIHNFSFLLARHHEPQSISPKLLLPIIPIGIVTYAFTLVLDNLCQNSCRKDYTISSEIRSRVSAIDFDIAEWRLSLYDEGSAVFPIARDWVLWRNAG